jgi:hypothetical protein
MQFHVIEMYIHRTIFARGGHTYEAAYFAEAQKPRALGIYLFSMHQISHTGCFKKSFTTLKAFMNLFRGHAQCLELS